MSRQRQPVRKPYPLGSVWGSVLLGVSVESPPPPWLPWPFLCVVLHQCLSLALSFPIVHHEEVTSVAYLLQVLLESLSLHTILSTVFFSSAQENPGSCMLTHMCHMCAHMCNTQPEWQLLCLSPTGLQPSVWRFMTSAGHEFPPSPTSCS